jgi:flavodoxin
MHTSIQQRYNKNKEDNEVQVARLLNLMVTMALKIYNTLSIADTDTVETILKHFEQYFSKKKKKKNEAMAFYKFFTRNQQQDKTFDSFITSLKELVKQCDFKSNKGWILTSRVVLGI